MIAVGYRLGIDYGTSNTAAVIQEPGGPTRPLLFDGHPQLPSAVCAAGAPGDPGDRGLLVGREAIHAARVGPERFEPHPKRRIDDGTVLLGAGEYPVTHLVAAVLAHVRAEAVRTMGAPPAAVALAYPASWAARRRAILLEAARLAELGVPALVPEPVAAAAHVAHGTGAEIPAGDCVVVYDFGAGTFDASVVRRTATGWAVAASDGLPDAGGLDVDAAIVAYLGAVYAAGHPDGMARLDRPESAADRRARRNLWQDVCTAKEILSRAAATYVHVPIIDRDALLGREQLERLAAPVVERTVALTRAVIAASVPAGRLAGLFLVGGASRMPLVATLLHRGTGAAPAVTEQPELAVAHGSVTALAGPAPAGHPHAAIRRRAAVAGADPVSAETVALVVRPVAPQQRPPDPMPGPDATPLPDTVPAPAPESRTAPAPADSAHAKAAAPGTSAHDGAAPELESRPAATPVAAPGDGARDKAARRAGGAPDEPAAGRPGRAPDGAVSPGGGLRDEAVVPGGGDRGEAGAGRGGGALFVAVVLLGGLAVMAGLARGAVPGWGVWLGAAALQPAYALWLAYLFAAPPSRTQWRAALHVAALFTGGTGACWAAGRVARHWGSGPLLWTLGAVVLLGGAGLLLARPDRTRAVFGPGDAAGLVLAAAAFGAAQVAGPAAAIGPGMLLAGGPAVVAFVGAGAALGRYVAARAAGARRWLPHAAAALLLAGGVATAVRVAAELH